MDKEKICPICKKSFTTKYNAKKYCSKDCYLENKKEYKRGDKYKLWCRKYDAKYRLTDNYKLSQEKFNSSEKRRKYLKTYHSSKKGKESLRKYYNSVKGKENMWKHKWKRRAAKMNIIELFTMKEWKDKVKLTIGICPCCKSLFDNGLHKLSLDHIYSLIRAYNDFKRTGIKRVYTIDDVQPLCKSCNSIKQDKIEKFI
jgi:hypothetical protein